MIGKQTAGKERLAVHKAGEDNKSETRCLLENAIAVRPQTGETRLEEDELTGDSFLLFAAGTDTTANILTFGTWYLLNNPEVYQKLKQQLRDFIPDQKSNQLNPWQEVEKLPYLTAVVKESLRLSFATVHRLMRISHDTEHVVQGHHLSPGTIICYSNGIHHLSEKHFKDASKFIPERWLDASSRDLEHNLVSFPRSPRTCIGQKEVNALLIKRLHASPNVI